MLKAKTCNDAPSSAPADPVDRGWPLQSDLSLTHLRSVFLVSWHPSGLSHRNTAESFMYSLSPISVLLPPHIHKHAYSPSLSLTVSCRALCRQRVHFFGLEWQGDIACHISIPWQSPFLLRVIISFGVKGSICYKRTRAAGTERKRGVEDEPYLGSLVCSGQAVLIGELRRSLGWGRAAALADVRSVSGQWLLCQPTLHQRSVTLGCGRDREENVSPERGWVFFFRETARHVRSSQMTQDPALWAVNGGVITPQWNKYTRELDSQRVIIR